VRLLLPIIIVMLLRAVLFDKRVCHRGRCTRFFIAAAIAFGLHYATRESALAEIEASSNRD
jgi:hypothetical protein